MTWLDRLLQRWRMRMAVRELPAAPRLLDLGTADGQIFAAAGATGVGIDPELEDAPVPAGVELVRGLFPADLPAGGPDATFTAATALAVVEHVPDGELGAWADALAGLLAPGAPLVITVPAPAVDAILHVLMRLHLVAGMQAHQHHGFVPSDLDAVFCPPAWTRRRHRTFQLGLNHLYVFVRTGPGAGAAPPARG